GISQPAKSVKVAPAPSWMRCNGDCFSGVAPVPGASVPIAPAPGAAVPDPAVPVAGAPVAGVPVASVVIAESSWGAGAARTPPLSLCLRASPVVPAFTVGGTVTVRFPEWPSNCGTGPERLAGRLAPSVSGRRCAQTLPQCGRGLMKLC